jgi:hypothetical protein
MTADTAGRAVPTTWIDAQPAHLIDAAVELVRSDDPDAWKLFGGYRSPRYALWAYLCLGHAETVPFLASMDLVDALRGAAGPGAFRAGMSPAEAALTLAGETAHRPPPRSRSASPSPTYKVEPVEVDL